MSWKNNLREEAPKTGELILRYNPLQKTYRLIRWIKVHKSWREGNQWVGINKSDLWMNIPEVK